jgi:hypothetical protein
VYIAISSHSYPSRQKRFIVNVTCVRIVGFQNIVGFFFITLVVVVVVVVVMVAA